ncbi:MAG: hypothetical protein ACFCAD_17225 [Pleurocapsa sp.]
MEEFDNLAQQAFYLLVGGTAIAAENINQFLTEFPEQIQNLAEDAIVKGEETCQRWSEESEQDWDWSETPSDNVSVGLRRRLFALVNGDLDLAERLLNQLRIDHPNRSESWYYEKVIYDLERDR